MRKPRQFDGVKRIEASILTPGPLGHNDYASPDSTVPGFSPGPLGINDHATIIANGYCFSDGRIAEILSLIRPTPGADWKLKDNDYADAANCLGAGVSAAIVKAFAEVESGGKSGFGADGLPIIAFEGHIFRRLTNKGHDLKFPLLSYPYKEKAGPQWRQNNRNQHASWKTLQAAVVLDFNAALQACSWGMFQIMGFNYNGCGFSRVREFVSAMKKSERQQLLAFISFSKRREGLSKAMADKDFVTMARLYNGEDYGDYDKLIEKAYLKHSQKECHRHHL